MSVLLAVLLFVSPCSAIIPTVSDVVQFATANIPYFESVASDVLITQFMPLQFLSAMPPQAQLEFYTLLTNNTIPRGQQIAALEQWAGQNNVASQVNASFTAFAAELQALNATIVAGMTQGLPSLMTAIYSITGNMSSTFAQDQQSIAQLAQTVLGEAMSVLPPIVPFEVTKAATQFQINPMTVLLNFNISQLFDLSFLSQLPKTVSPFTFYSIIFNKATPKATIEQQVMTWAAQYNLSAQVGQSLGEYSAKMGQIQQLMQAFLQRLSTQYYPALTQIITDPTISQQQAIAQAVSGLQVAGGDFLQTYTQVVTMFGMNPPLGFPETATTTASASAESTPASA